MLGACCWGSYYPVEQFGWHRQIRLQAGGPETLQRSQCWSEAGSVAAVRGGTGHVARARSRLEGLMLVGWISAGLCRGQKEKPEALLGGSSKLFALVL